MGEKGGKAMTHFDLAAFEALEGDDEEFVFTGCEGDFGGVVCFRHFVCDVELWTS